MISRPAGVAAAILAAVFVFLAPPARADKVSLANGDVLEGTVKGLEAGELVVDTPFAGEVRLDWRAVRTLTTDGAYDVRLASGERVRGRLASEREEELGTEEDAPPATSSAEKLVIATEDGVREVRPRDVVAIGGTAARAFYGELGYAYSTGGAEGHGAYARAGARLADERTLGYLDGLFAYGERGGHTARRETVLEGTLARAIGGPLYGALDADLLLDEFRAVDARLALSGGLGWRADLRASGVLFVDAGPAWVREWRDRGRDVSEAAIRLGARLDADVAGPLALDVRALLLESMQRADRLRARVAAGPRVEVYRGLYLAARVVFEYDGDPAPGVGHEETAFEAGLGWRF